MINSGKRGLGRSLLISLGLSIMLIITAGASDIVTGISGSEVLQKTTKMHIQNEGISRWGICYSLSNDKKEFIGKAVIGVFSSSAEGMIQFRDRVIHTAVQPERVYTVGDQAVRWGDRILFIRHNALIDLQFPRNVKLGIASGDVEKYAHTLDHMIQNGSDGVKKGDRIDKPIIGSVSYKKNKLKVEELSKQHGQAGFLDNFGISTQMSSAVEIGFGNERCVMATPLKITSETLVLLVSDPPLSPEAIRQKQEKEAKEHERQLKEIMDVLKDKNADVESVNKAVIQAGNLKDTAVIPFLEKIISGKKKSGGWDVVSENAVKALARIRKEANQQHGSGK
ncbi:hypothetical protein LLG95_09065 [bacterium]|nr:hypothetical protein [bacterium]